MALWYLINDSISPTNSLHLDSVLLVPLSLSSPPKLSQMRLGLDSIRVYCARWLADLASDVGIMPGLGLPSSIAGVTATGIEELAAFLGCPH